MSDRTRLPKWAQREIERLENDLASANRKLAEGPEDSDTFADPYSDTPRPLGKGTSVEFRLGPEIADKIHVRIERGKVNVYGGDYLRIYPQASNVINVVPDRFKG